MKMFLGIVGTVFFLFLLVHLQSVTSIALVISRIVTPPCILPTSYHIARMHAIESRGNMGWSSEVEHAVEHLLHCKSDDEFIVKQLLLDRSGTIASLGMDEVVRREMHDGESMLREHFNDTRWNHNLVHNDEYARFLFALWKIQKEQNLTEEDSQALSNWPAWYFERLGVTDRQ